MSKSDEKAFRDKVREDLVAIGDSIANLLKYLGVQISKQLPGTEQKLNQEKIEVGTSGKNAIDAAAEAVAKTLQHKASATQEPPTVPRPKN
jgi:hypothetical protein